MASSANLTAATVHGVKWTTAATITTSILQVGYTAVMARLLTPTAFGLVALAGLVLRFGSYFAQMGMEQALIQKTELHDNDVRVAFTSSVLLSLLFAGLLMVGAPLAVPFFHEPAVVPVVRVLACGLLLTGLNATAVSVLRRQLRFRTLAIIEVASFVLSYGVLGIGLAAAGYGVWALVGAQLGQTLLLTILSYGAVRHSVRLLLRWEAYRPLVSYGSRMSLISFLEFFTSSLDTLLIGRLLGAAALGLYSRAWMLVGLPVYLLTSSVAKVVFPSFSQVQTDRTKLGTVYLSSIVLIGALVMPICAGVSVAAREVVLVMLGPKWLEAVPILRIVCAAFGLSMVTMFAGVVCDATATLSRKLLLNVVYTAVLAGLFVGLSRYGLLGVAAAVVLGELVRTLLYLGLMRRVLGLSPWAILRAYGPGLQAAATVSLAIGAVAYGTHGQGWPLPVVFGLEVVAGAVGLGVALLLLPSPRLQEVVGRILSRLSLPQSGWAAGLVHVLLRRFPQPACAADAAEVPATTPVPYHAGAVSAMSAASRPRVLEHTPAEPELS
ncbi:lipopolysaccharide biosynthesis protein [Hymenobacter busanensis]|uniref:Lipopolysaccharide biosynthesis protein n=1 Tax=Hymenobacter busanensis TaxID=2607656 RepID=A0A7L4ZVD3_9BACT|nr:lipopolysaccharide biosynthesis protein [Hymenobacter busanensis]KAA9339261.1 lipopolysaccharide biosynthesis protein [Hymenobacter busanensis]QHJ06977.1 oligosaccharide flippase family protein [Hymenobacter busanensis]